MKKKLINLAIMLTISLIVVSSTIGIIENKKVEASYGGTDSIGTFCTKSWSSVKDLAYQKGATIHDSSGNAEYHANNCCWHSASADGHNSSNFYLKGIIDFDGFGNFTVYSDTGTYNFTDVPGAAALAYFGAHVSNGSTGRSGSRADCWQLLEKGTLSKINGKCGIPKFGSRQGDWRKAGYMYDESYTAGLLKKGMEYEANIKKSSFEGPWYRGRAFIFLSQDGHSNMQDRMCFFGGVSEEPTFKINKYVQSITNLNKNTTYKFEDKDGKKEDRVKMSEDDKKAEPAETGATHIRVRYRISVSNTGPVTFKGILTDSPEKKLFGDNPVKVIRIIKQNGEKVNYDDKNFPENWEITLDPGKTGYVYIEIEGKENILSGTYQNKATFKMTQYKVGSTWKNKTKEASSSDYVKITATAGEPKIDKYIVSYDGNDLLESDGKTPTRENKKNAWKKENAVEVGLDSTSHTVIYTVVLTNTGTTPLEGTFLDEPDSGINISSIKIGDNKAIKNPTTLSFPLTLDDGQTVTIQIGATLDKNSKAKRYKNIATYNCKNIKNEEFTVSSRDFLLIEETPEPKIRKYIFKTRGEEVKPVRKDFSNNEKKTDPVEAKERKLWNCI